MRERDYLVSLGLAKAGARGRFSREAQAALVKARAEGMTFDTPVVSVPREARTEPRERPIDVPERSSYSPKAVRAWAADKGIELGSRGRIDRNIIAQYLQEQDGETVQAAIAAETSTDPSVIVEIRARTIPVGTMFVHIDENGKRGEPIADSSICVPCGVSLSHHLCSRPQSFVRGQRDYVPVVEV